ncbi:hypothetical protein P8625_11820 [Tenacibaculum tangerinum]|uniref:Bacterial EndoU nuclease domain-containing protein n=1 Tax=Tenacibaculum tangerinum TaxID=3038772 RepID=A0ABY8L4D5_9FLAO|nr:EndoU domain-containing protein [Tenacibaculum tangerinum]WGH74765.1 hypothetical protein P8625_11820 [Tenacibaculum tangerinum]
MCFVSAACHLVGCFFLTKNGKEVLTWNSVELVTKEKTGDYKNFFKKVYEESRAKKISPHKYLDELAESVRFRNLRKAAYIKWIEKFEKKFHLHFDGELKLERLSRRDGTQVLRGTGGHNHLVIDKNIRIRRYLTEPVDDKPFDALISVRYKNGQWIDKKAKSSMFPKNWNEKRVKEEIALIYDKMIKEGFELKFPNNKYTGKGSTGFEITIEIDNYGNLTNAYPNIK